MGRNKKRRNRNRHLPATQTPNTEQSQSQPQTFAEALNNMSKSNATASAFASDYTKSYTPPTKVYGGYNSAWKKCHTGPIEVHKGLFLGSFSEATAMVKAPHNVSVLVPLNDLSGSIWNTGFRGEIMYYPITDYSILPTDVLMALAAKIILRLENGERVGVFCMGGHGRTGYVAATVLGMLGYADPIEHIRTKYCSEALETTSQLKHVAEVLNRPDLAEKYAKTVERSYSYGKYYDDYATGSYYGQSSYSAQESAKTFLKDEYGSKVRKHGGYSYDYDDTPLLPTSRTAREKETCGQCGMLNDGACFMFDLPRRETDEACDDYVPESYR